MDSHSLKELSLGLRRKTFSSVELTRYFLQRIKEHKALNAFISIGEEEALKAAKKADHLLKQGKASTLTGIPMAHKDIFCTKEFYTTCGSKMLANFKSPYQATIVKKLANQAAVLVGKTNMDEFAMGSSNESSYFGPVKNPWNNACVSGGSSGGSAAAVAAGLLPFATGSDTGGSIRQPASFCGISGLKPTYGLVSRFGLIAYASSLDQAGPMARSAEDLALILSVIAGFDRQDSTSVKHKIPVYANYLDRPLKGVRIAIPPCFFQNKIDPAIANALTEAIAVLQQQGASIRELDLKLQPWWVPCYYVIACAEAASNLARYDGIRFGYQYPHASNLTELIIKSRSEGFGSEVKRRILMGTHILSVSHFDAYYMQALKLRRLIKMELQAMLGEVDIILGPTTPTVAFKLGEKIKNPYHGYLADLFTVSANLAGMPALSIPIGLSEAGLPMGMQLLGNYFEETLLLNVAHQYQQCTNWHQIKPC